MPRSSEHCFDYIEIVPVSTDEYIDTNAFNRESENQENGDHLENMKPPHGSGYPRIGLKRCRIIQLPRLLPAPTMKYSVVQLEAWRGEILQQKVDTNQIQL